MIYYFHREYMPVYLLAAFGKNEQANLSAAERHALAKVAAQLTSILSTRHEQGIH